MRRAALTTRFVPVARCRHDAAYTLSSMIPRRHCDALYYMQPNIPPYCYAASSRATLRDDAARRRRAAVAAAFLRHVRDRAVHCRFTLFVTFSTRPILRHYARLRQARALLRAG